MKLLVVVSGLFLLPMAVPLSSLPPPARVVAVTGATGRTGQLVVEELLQRGTTSVLALVRDPEKAAALFNNHKKNLQIITCDLTNETQVGGALATADAAIWCATGFANTQPSSPPTGGGGPMMEALGRFLQVFGLSPPAPSAPVTRSGGMTSIDIVGLPFVAKALAAKKVSDNSKTDDPLPKLVMCSAAGVTRPTWSQEKRERLLGAADIPIVRLNPFGILDVKRASEEALRASRVVYTIVRPVGLIGDGKEDSDKPHPPGGRPIFSQGDVAVGRIHRRDLAKMLVNVLDEPAAASKTFEVFTLPGQAAVGSNGNAINNQNIVLAPPVSMHTALSRLATDDYYQQQHLASAELAEGAVTATYYAMQQLLPGVQQKSAALAMGQTYEQFDQGKTGRLGPRGQENAAQAAPQPTS
jgi:nucleoside-diphosphate-sugar epimerase